MCSDHVAYQHAVSMTELDDAGCGDDYLRCSCFQHVGLCPYQRSDLVEDATLDFGRYLASLVCFGLAVVVCWALEAERFAVGQEVPSQV